MGSSCRKLGSKMALSLAVECGHTEWGDQPGPYSAQVLSPSASPGDDDDDVGRRRWLVPCLQQAQRGPRSDSARRTENPEKT